MPRSVKTKMSPQSMTLTMAGREASNSRMALSGSAPAAGWLVAATASTQQTSLAPTADHRIASCICGKPKKQSRPEV